MKKSSAAEVLRQGLEYAMFNESRQKVCERTNLERFHAFYGVGPETVAAVINDNQDIDPKDIFMTLNWWKVYNVEHVMSGLWGPHPETIRSVVKNVCCKLSKKKMEKIIFDNFHKHQTYLASIDCVHFEVDEFRTDPGSKWYSHKFNGSGLSYEVCCDVVQDRIVWVNGPFPASKHDITIFRGGKRGEKSKWRSDSLFSQVPNGKRLIGDSGYVGEPKKISATLGGHSKEVKEYFARAKSRQETINARYKNFRILGTSFWHKGEKGSGSKGKMDLHGSVFNAITVVLQYDLENGNPLFDM